MPASCDILSLRPQAADWRTVGGEVIAIERATSTYLTANEAGSALWEALVTGATLRQLVDLISNRYGISASRATADVEQFLSALDERGLLSRS